MLVTVYDDSTMSKSNVFKWHKCFREGREDVNESVKQGEPMKMSEKSGNLCNLTAI
jgi:hypothetical protein